MASFEIASPEGLPIRGNISAPSDPRALVVVIHGFKGFKDWGFFPWLAEHLCAEELAVVRFNMSRSGIGENMDTFDRLDLFRDDTYSTQIADVLTTVRYAQSRFDALPTFLVGHSRGGGVALLSAQDISDLAGVVTWSAISHVDRWDADAKRKWRADGYMDIENQRTKQMMRMSTAMLDDAVNHDIVAAVEKLDVPLLVVHGGRDESVPVEEAREISASARDCSLVILESASHTYNAIHPLVNVPRELSYAAAVTSHFCNAYA
jgi:pimeloyl-ACP methyl ester carboxylesterase